MTPHMKVLYLKALTGVLQEVVKDKDGAGAAIYSMFHKVAFRVTRQRNYTVNGLQRQVCERLRRWIEGDRRNLWEKLYESTTQIWEDKEELQRLHYKKNKNREQSAKRSNK
jgi:hypothetical protein